ncbi:MAG: hypothetical protein P4L96_18070 [Rhodoferax sp.]|nr:hypothetical protein [Rhodoferax sp.]
MHNSRKLQLEQATLMVCGFMTSGTRLPFGLATCPLAFFGARLSMLLLELAHAAINLHDVTARGGAFRADLKTWHFMLGLGVFVLVAVRLVARLFAGTTPPIVPAIPHRQQRLAEAVHIGLYVFMIGMPLFVRLAVSAKGDPVLLFCVHCCHR